VIKDSNENPVSVAYSDEELSGMNGRTPLGYGPAADVAIDGLIWGNKIESAAHAFLPASNLRIP
jgi:hypothetical protein